MDAGEASQSLQTPITVSSCAAFRLILFKRSKVELEAFVRCHLNTLYIMNTCFYRLLYTHTLYAYDEHFSLP